MTPTRNSTNCCERVTELLGQPHADPSIGPSGHTSPVTTRSESTTNWFRSPAALVGFAAIIVAAAFGGYYFRGGETMKKNDSTTSSVDDTGKTRNVIDSRNDPDLEKRIKDLAGMFGGAIPATSLAKGFYVPDLGLRVAFISAEQSAATLGSLPTGAVVMEVESGRPAVHAGLQVGDVVTTIGGKSIGSEDDLRQAIFKIGPGRTRYSYRRGNDSKTVAIDCQKCKAE